MKCPRCLEDLYCPCTHCVKKRPVGKILWTWSEDGSHIICPHCSFAGLEKFCGRASAKEIEKWRSENPSKIIRSNMK